MLYWDKSIRTDRTVDYDRPDIVLIDKNSGKISIIDIACPLTHNIKKTVLWKQW